MSLLDRINATICPHPLVRELRTYPGIKTLFPFFICIIVLFTYISLDNSLPVGSKYSDIEFSKDAATLQGHIYAMSGRQLCIFGFSVGLHLLNALMYAVTLATSSAYCGLQLHAGGHVSLAKVFDWICYAQVLTCMIYVTQHSLLFSQFASPTPSSSSHIALAVFVLGILFLVQICVCALSILAALVWVNLSRRQHGATPFDLLLRKEKEFLLTQQQEAMKQPQQQLISVGRATSVATASNANVEENGAQDAKLATFDGVEQDV